MPSCQHKRVNSRQTGITVYTTWLRYIASTILIQCPLGAYKIKPSYRYQIKSILRSGAFFKTIELLDDSSANQATSTPLPFTYPSNKSKKSIDNISWVINQQSHTTGSNEPLCQESKPRQPTYIELDQYTSDSQDSADEIDIIPSMRELSVNPSPTDGTSDEVMRGRDRNVNISTNYSNLTDCIPSSSRAGSTSLYSSNEFDDMPALEEVDTVNGNLEGPSLCDLNYDPVSEAHEKQEDSFEILVNDPKDDPSPTASSNVENSALYKMAESLTPDDADVNIDSLISIYAHTLNCYLRVKASQIMTHTSLKMGDKKKDLFGKNYDTSHFDKISITELFEEIKKIVGRDIPTAPSNTPGN